MRIKNRQVIHVYNQYGMHNIHAVHGINVASEFHRHIHERFCIGIVRKGVRVIRYKDKSTTIPQNALFVINPGISHECKSLCEEHSYFVICVEKEYMKAIASQISGKLEAVPYFKSSVIHNKELGRLLNRFLFLSQEISLKLERETVLTSFLHALTMQYGEEPPIPPQSWPHDNAMNKVCEFIRKHYRQDLSLRQLSKIACLSPFYFQRLFLTKKGISPHEYLLQVRIRNALAFLSEGRNIASVALDTGFFDQSHFTHSFRRVMGITPGEYFRTATVGRSNTKGFIMAK